MSVLLWAVVLMLPLKLLMWCFMNSKVHSIFQAINISRDTIRIAWQNVIFALGVKNTHHDTRSYGICFHVGSSFCRYWRSYDLYFKLHSHSL